MWEDAVESITVSDDGGKRTITVPSWGDAADGKLKDVTVGVLPASVSRHNCPAAPFAVSGVMAGVSAPGAEKTLGVVTILSDSHDAMPTAAAVARAFPTYTAKSSDDRATPEGRGSVTLKGAVHVAAALVSPGDDTLAAVPAEAWARASAAAAAIRLAARLVDTPPAEMDPDAMVREAEAVRDALNEKLAPDGTRIGSNILRYDMLKAGGFGGLVAVGDAAARDGREPALVHLTYTPRTETDDGKDETKRPRRVALVGKGITFDTGGLSIKPRTGMCGMKSDMGGAAAMLAAFKALAELRPPHVEIHLLLCVAENAVGPAAFRPDDVVTAFSGRTIEVNNTDAEGRVVLADGVAYASGPLQCDDVIDMATLTGAQMVATGRHFAGILSDDEAMETAAVAAGKSSGDLTHPLPYAPEFFTREFSSKIADMMNSVKDRSNAQASCAGQLIANHLDAGWKAEGDEAAGEARSGARRWLHVDMAGPSTDKASGRGTGYGVPLLVELLTGNFFTGGPGGK